MPANNPWAYGYPSFAQVYQPGTYGGLYGAPGGSNAFEDSPFGQQYLEDSPQAAYQRWLTKSGYGGMDRRSQLAQSLYGRLQTGYEAALGDNPFMGWATRPGNYLSTVNLGDLLRQMTPTQRGENLPQFAPSSRWLLR